MSSLNKYRSPMTHQTHLLMALIGLISWYSPAVLASSDKWSFAFPRDTKRELVIEVPTREVQGDYLKAMELASMRCLKTLRPQRIINEEEALDLIDICSNPKAITR